MLAARYAARPLLDIDFRDNASFTISVDGSMWLESAPLRLFSERWRSLVHGSVTTTDGTDVLGRYRCKNVTWNAEESRIVLHTALCSYLEHDIAIFYQQLPLGAHGTNASNPVLPGQLRVMDPGNYPPVVSFPAVTGPRLEHLGFLTWESRMVSAEWGKNISSGPSGNNEPLITGRGPQGLSTGPVALYDSELRTAVFGPMDNFKNTVNHIRASVRGSVWETGVSSEVEELPAGFVHRTMLVVDQGVTAALDKWGSALRKVYGTSRVSKADPNVEYLSYWTDNGAYYSASAWGEAGGGGKFVNETTFRKLGISLAKQELLDAIQIIQLDDWFYEGRSSDYSNCITNWTLPSSTFPSGLRGLSMALGKPWLL